MASAGDSLATLSARLLTERFGDRTALHDVSFELQAGEIVGVIGPNARLEKLGDPEAAVDQMLAQTGLKDRAEEQVGRLSGGNQQRVNVAIGLLSEPSALLLDEPSASLDPRQRERLWQFTGALAERGKAVVFSTHNVAEVERYASRVLVLVDGELLFAGTPLELEQVVGGDPRDLEAAFVRFLHSRGH
jgi:ABC-2 type transport system ATP-binding protein